MTHCFPSFTVKGTLTLNSCFVAQDTTNSSVCLAWNLIEDLIREMGSLKQVIYKNLKSAESMK